MQYLIKMLFIVLLLFQNPVFASIKHSKKLVKEVKFWENIFMKYKPEHCVVHDKKNVNIIYIVKKVPLNNNRKRGIAVKKILKKVRRTLNRFARGMRVKSKFERIIKKRIPRNKRSISKYKIAARNLRCQRGVDFRPSLKRSKRILPMIKKIFRKNKIPVDIAYLPHLESGFRSRVRSHAGARGLWQFLSFDGRKNGLRINRFVDERTSVIKSTKAAVKHFKKLKKSLKKWPIAITAYNYGYNGMKRAVKKYGYNYHKIRIKHKTRIFGFAVKNYYPSFLAVRNIAKRYERKRSKSLALKKKLNKKRSRKKRRLIF